MRLREKYRPDYVAWINDAGTSFRAERYPEYKSTREKLDDELQADFDRAVERIRGLLEAFRIPLVTVPGYEADDVIGTLATRAAPAACRRSSSPETRIFISSSAPASPCSTPAAAARRRSRRPGWTSPMHRSVWASRLARWWTTSRWWATRPTTSPASAASARRVRRSSWPSTATSIPCSRGRGK